VYLAMTTSLSATALFGSLMKIIGGPDPAGNACGEGEGYLDREQA